jgi:hypothetical protein
MPPNRNRNDDDDSDLHRGLRLWDEKQSLGKNQKWIAEQLEGATEETCGLLRKLLEPFVRGK